MCVYTLSKFSSCSTVVGFVWTENEEKMNSVRSIYLSNLSIHTYTHTLYAVYSILSNDWADNIK